MRRSLAVIVLDKRTTVWSMNAENESLLIGIRAFHAKRPLMRPPRPVAQANESQASPTDHAVLCVAA